MTALSTAASVEFRNRLRAARAVALADSEGYLDLLHAIEELGAFLTRSTKAHGLGAYQKRLIALVTAQGLGAGEFEQLLTALRHARNDAAHLGAAARRTTMQAIDVAIILEEALMTKLTGACAEHYMVEDAVCAEGWHTVAMIRRSMLRSQFSALPFRKNKKWFLVTDSAVVRFLATGGAITTALEDATSLHLDPARVVAPTTKIEELRRNDAGLVLVVESDHLRGVIAPFDLL